MSIIHTKKKFFFIVTGIIKSNNKQIFVFNKICGNIRSSLGFIRTHSVMYESLSSIYSIHLFQFSLTLYPIPLAGFLALSLLPSSMYTLYTFLDCFINRTDLDLKIDVSVVFVVVVWVEFMPSNELFFFSLLFSHFFSSILIVHSVVRSCEGKSDVDKVPQIKKKEKYFLEII